MIQEFEVVDFPDDLIDLSGGIVVEEFECYFFALGIDSFADLSEGAFSEDYSMI